MVWESLTLTCYLFTERRRGGKVFSDGSSRSDVYFRLCKRV